MDHGHEKKWVCERLVSDKIIIQKSDCNKEFDIKYERQIQEIFLATMGTKARKEKIRGKTSHTEEVYFNPSRGRIFLKQVFIKNKSSIVETHNRFFCEMFYICFIIFGIIYIFFVISVRLSNFLLISSQDIINMSNPF